MLPAMVAARQQKEPPVWQRIAELGFADAVESKGFKRVGKTHWKMEGDGLTWRVLLVKGYKDTPGSFDAVHGAFVHGLDELYSRFEGRRASSPLRQSSARAHLISDIGSDVTRVQKKEYDRLYPDRKEEGWRELWRSLIDPDMRPSFEWEFLNINYWARAGSQSHQWCFVTQGADLQDVADVLSDYWDRYSWPRIEKELSFEELYRREWGPDIWHDPRILDPFNFAVAKMAGDDHYINDMAAYFIADAERSYADVKKECARKGELDRKRLRRIGITKEQYLANVLDGKQFRKKRLLDICQAFDIELDDQ